LPNELAAVPEAEAKLREDLALERGRREGIERTAAAAFNRPPQAPPPPIEDPFDRFANDSLKMTPEETKAALDHGTRLRVRDEVARSERMIGDRVGRALQAQAYDAAMDSAYQSNPDMAESPEKVAAAAAAVEYEIRQKGQNVSPGEYVRRTVGKFRQMFKPGDSAAPPPPYVEGSTPPSAAAPLKPAAPAAEKPPNPFVEWYGPEAESAKVFDENAQKDLENITSEYALDKNEYLDVKGGRSWIPKVVRPMMKRKRDRAAAAAAGK